MGPGILNSVRENRLAAGLTQEQLGRAVGVSRQTIISIEGGRYVPSLPLALKLARYFGRATDEIFNLEEGS
jgi:putative transcriptional regulator